MASLYIRNLEYLCRKNKTDQSTLADTLGIDFTDMRRPTPEELIRIADHFGIGLDQLVRLPTYRNEELKSQNIRLFVTDVDGVLTDGGMFYTESGDEFKKFNAKDGIAIKALKSKGIQTGIISHGINKNLISRRAALLDISLVEVGTTPKLDLLKAWCTQLGIELSQVAYIGDDLTDLDCIKSVGISVCPNDAVSEVKRYCKVVTRAKGGEGCVREFLDEFLL
jgi:3-deoxy-D-manno-octulosonate 8-phosphate phosphatase (KDO 8-P phosphatase)